MSLVRIALRIAGVQALKGRTDVGDNVLDSQLGVLDISADGMLRTDQKKPFLALYTDASRAGIGEGAPESSRLDVRALTTNGAVDIILEAGITAAMVETDPDTDETVLVGLGIPVTDANLEAQLDIIVRQAGDALSDPDNEWADIFRGLTYRYLRIERARAASAEGQRVAAHQVRITAELIDDPVIGEPLDADSSLARLLAKAAALDASPDVAALVAKIMAMTGGADPDWKSLQRRHGLTQAELLALGRGPLAQDEERETPDFDTGTIEVEGTGTFAEEDQSGD